MAAPVSVSTIGTMIWASQVARSWACRLSSTFSSNSWRLTASRPMPWTVRTPWMPSASAPFRVELVIRARRNARLARGIQMIRTTTRIGTTDRVRRPSCQSSTSSTKAMPTSSTKSPIANTEVSRNSCKACTSPCRRDIRRPTSVLSMNDSETRCRCAYMRAPQVDQQPLGDPPDQDLLDQVGHEVEADDRRGRPGRRGSAAARCARSGPARRRSRCARSAESRSGSRRTPGRRARRAPGARR